MYSWLAQHVCETLPASQKAQIMHRVSQLMDEAKACEKKLKVSYGSEHAVLTHNVQLHMSFCICMQLLCHGCIASRAPTSYNDSRRDIRPPAVQPWLPSRRLLVAAEQRKPIEAQVAAFRATGQLEGSERCLGLTSQSLP